METHKERVLAACVSGSWRGAVAGGVWALPALVIHPGVFLIAGAVAATAGSLLGFVAAAPAGSATSNGVSRLAAGVLGATSAVALWAFIVGLVYAAFDVRGLNLDYFTVGPAAVGSVFGWWNAVAHHRATDARPLPPRADPARTVFISSVLGLVVLAVVGSRLVGLTEADSAPETSRPVPVTCQERSGGDTVCPGG